MKRRNFIKLSLVLSSFALMPKYMEASELVLSDIDFSEDICNDNAAQTLIIYLYGGASQLSGNLSNLEEIEKYSQNSYADYFNNTLTQTTNLFWKEAGGEEMEKLIENGDMTLFRTCYSAKREENNNKAHGVCTEENQKGTKDLNAAGILANLGQILENHNIINSNSLMPFVSMEGESIFYREGYTPLSAYLKPMGINEKFDNPYYRNRVRNWYYYTQEERDSAPDTYNKSDEEGGFDPALTASMDNLAQEFNTPGDIKNSFEKRVSRDTFMREIATVTTPDLGEDAYPENDFAKKIETSIKLLVHNPETKVLTLGTGGLGGWDDHNEAREYIGRMKELFSSLKSAMAHLKAEEKNNKINIMVFGEFGRNVNLNLSNGWDHGNLQNLFILGGNDYFNHKGVVGETRLVSEGEVNRLYLKPTEESYWFDPLSIAATLYKIYGIENPEILTDGNMPIAPLFEA
jgi:hypothetical protein